MILLQIKLTLEDGTFLNDKAYIGDYYKTHKNTKDNILYILFLKEIAVIGFVKKIYY